MQTVIEVLQQSNGEKGQELASLKEMVQEQQARWTEFEFRN
jgi:hypothetical protein